MTETTQSLSNHTRWHTPFHFVLGPIMLFHLLWSSIRLYQVQSLDRAEAVILAVGLVVLTLLVRVNPLKAQDRLIRLEEQLRYQRVLSPELAERAAELPVGFMVALRFASDEELPDLVRDALDRKFAKPAEIKKAIQNWRGDHFRV